MNHVPKFRTIFSRESHQPDRLSPLATRLVDTMPIHELNISKFTRYCYCENFTTDTSGRHICSNGSDLHTNTWNERTRYCKSSNKQLISLQQQKSRRTPNPPSPNHTVKKLIYHIESIKTSNQTEKRQSSHHQEVPLWYLFFPPR
jgi:hypothetical protein